MAGAQEMLLKLELGSHFCTLKTNAVIVKPILLSSEQLVLLFLFRLFGNSENRNN